MEQENDSGINETEDLSLFGYKFHPSDEELIYYALKRIIEGPLFGGVESFFMKRDLYGVEPGEFLHGTVAGGSVYIFTKLKKKSKNGIRIDRTVAEKGTWKEKDKIKTLYGLKNQIIGWRKGFAYVPNSKSKFKTEDDHEYRMKEYSFPNSVLVHAKYKDYVLCKIKKLRRKKKNKDHGGYLQQEHDSLDLITLPEPDDQQREITPMKLDKVGADLCSSSIESHAALPQYYPHPYSMPYHHAAPPPSAACQAEPILIEEVLLNGVEGLPATCGGYYQHLMSTSMESYAGAANSRLSTQELSPAATLPAAASSQPGVVLVEQEDLDPISMPINDYQNRLETASASAALTTDPSPSTAPEHQAEPKQNITDLVQSSTTSWSDQLQTDDQDHIHHHLAKGVNDFASVESLTTSNPSSTVAEPIDDPPANPSFGQLLDESITFDTSLDDSHSIQQLYEFISQPLCDDQEDALLPEEFVIPWDDNFFQLPQHVR